MVEQVRHDLRKSPLPVTELHVTGGRYGLKLRVGEVAKHTEGVLSGRQSLKQLLTTYILGAVGSAVPVLVVTASVAAGSEK